MQIELINTGAELLLGRILNTHQQWLCRQLADLGYLVTRQVCIADDAPQIQAAVRDSLSRADLIVTTGGLGPTSDDLTRDLIARLLERPLAFDPQVLAQIEQYYAQRRRVMPASTRVQAMVPAGARVLANANGTAPGLAIEVNPNPFRPETRRSWLVLLPGPPRELRPMFSESVVPLLLREFPQAAPYACRTLKTTGLGESLVEERIAGPLGKLVSAGLELGYCARIGEVEVRLAARGGEALALVRQAEEIVRGLLGRLIYATDDGTLEGGLVQSLTEQKQTLALAESCTGGLIAHRITNVPGASAVFLCGLVTYSNEARNCWASAPRHWRNTARSAKWWPAKWRRARGAAAGPITPSPSPALPVPAEAAKRNPWAPFSSRWPVKRERLPKSISTPSTVKPSNTSPPNNRWTCCAGRCFQRGALNPRTTSSTSRGRRLRADCSPSWGHGRAGQNQNTRRNYPPPSPSQGRPGGRGIDAQRADRSSGS